MRLFKLSTVVAIFCLPSLGLACDLGCRSTPMAERTPASVTLSQDDWILARRLCGVATLSKSSLNTPEFRACAVDFSRAITQSSLKTKHEIAVYICEHLTIGSDWKQKSYPRRVCYSNAVALMKIDALTRAAARCKGYHSDDPEVLRIAADCYRRAFDATAPSYSVNDSVFEALPLCSRIKYFHLPDKSQINQPLPLSFDVEAIREAKQIWEMSEVMERDTRRTCKATGVASLMHKPKTCSDEWSGPYLDPQLAVKYQGLANEDFEAFINCWK